MYERGQIRWIESDGGPLLLLSSAQLTAWSGYAIELEADGPSSSETDYERACAVEDYLGLIAVADGQGVVLGDEPMATAWRSVSSVEGIFIRWVYGEDEGQMSEYMSHIGTVQWRPTGVSLAVAGEPLYLFDAAWPGADVIEYEYLKISLDAGTYSFDTGTLRAGDRTELILHRLRRTQGIAGAIQEGD